MDLYVLYFMHYMGCVMFSSYLWYIKYQQCSCFDMILVQVYRRFNVYVQGSYTPCIYVVDHVTYCYTIFWTVGVTPWIWPSGHKTAAHPSHFLQIRCISVEVQRAFAPLLQTLSTIVFFYKYLQILRPERMIQQRAQVRLFCSL